jgi:hypothetical protein
MVDWMMKKIIAGILLACVLALHADAQDFIGQAGSQCVLPGSFAVKTLTGWSCSSTAQATNAYGPNNPSSTCILLGAGAICFGWGEPKLLAAKGSLYLRSDGTKNNNRAYVNVDGGSIWTPILSGM